MLKHILRSLVLISFLGPDSSLSQQPAPAAPAASQTAQLIRKAGLRQAEYRGGFKDLTAEETQRVEEYGDKGPKRRREIVLGLISTSPRWTTLS